MSQVVEELGIPDEFAEEFLFWDVEYHEDTGSSGEMVYGYFFYVPEEASEEILEEMDWKPGDTIRLSVNVFDSED